LAGLGERADTFGAAGHDVQMPQAGKKEEKMCDGKSEQGQIFVRIVGKLFVGNLRWSVRLEGYHRPWQ